VCQRCRACPRRRTRQHGSDTPSEHLATYAHATLVDRDELNDLDLLDSAPATIVSPARG